MNGVSSKLPVSLGSNQYNLLNTLKTLRHYVTNKNVSHSCKRMYYKLINSKASLRVIYYSRFNILHTYSFRMA